MKTRLDRKIVTGLIIAGVAFRLLLLFVIPKYPEVSTLPSYKDEPSHLQYIEYVANEKKIPVYKSTDVDSTAHLNRQFTQPPLYYIACAPLYKIGELMHSGWGLYGARLMSILFGMIAAYFAYLMALAYSRSQIVGISVLAAMLMAPNAAIFTTLATNDALLVCTASLAMFQIVRIRCGDQSLIRQVLVSVFLALTVYTKLSGILLFPLIWFAADPKSKISTQWLTRTRIAMFSLILLIPLTLWSQQNYGQIFPGQDLEIQVQSQSEQAVGFLRVAILNPINTVVIFLRTIPQPFTELWGSNLERITTVCWLLFWGALTLLGIIQGLYERPGASLFIASVVMMTAGFIYWSFYSSHIEFRLFIPAFPALAFLTALGMEQLKISPAAQVVAWCLPILISIWL